MEINLSPDNLKELANLVAPQIAPMITAAQLEPDWAKLKDVRDNLKWTQRGRKFIYDVLNSHGILPVLEQSELLPETGTIN
ncbi:hypothetical protein [Limosilactobacillus fermentum]